MAKKTSTHHFKDIRDYSAMRCPLHGFFNLLSGPWTLYILWLIVTNGPMRFGKLKQQVASISAKMLTERLRMLEEAGLVSRYQESTIPPKVTYSLTSRGEQMHEVLNQVNELAKSWVIEKCESTKPQRRG